MALCRQSATLGLVLCYMVAFRASRLPERWRLVFLLPTTLPLDAAMDNLAQALPGILGGAVIVAIPSVGNVIVLDILGGARGSTEGSLAEQQVLSARSGPSGWALPVIIITVVLTARPVACMTQAKSEVSAIADRDVRRPRLPDRRGRFAGYER